MRFGLDDLSEVTFTVDNAYIDTNVLGEMSNTIKTNKAWQLEPSSISISTDSPWATLPNKPEDRAVSITTSTWDEIKELKKTVDRLQKIISVEVYENGICYKRMF